MKLSILLLALGLGASSIIWAEEACEFAVELSDSHDFEDFHNCEQATSGLNRLLKGMVKREAQVPLKTTNRAPARALIQLESELKHAQMMEAESAPLETPTPAPLVQQRLQLFAQMTQACAKGFSLEAEEYRPHASGELILTYQYRCL